MNTRDVVRVQTLVRLGPAEAFRRFTDEIDVWWRRGSRFRWLTRGGTLRFVDGMLVEESDGERFVVGRVTEWQPGEHLAFEWRAPTFSDGETTQVDVRFQSEEHGTRVSVEHSGWNAIRSDHPARRNTGTTSAFSGLFGLYWADLLGSFRRT